MQTAINAILLRLCLKSDFFVSHSWYDGLHEKNWTWMPFSDAHLVCVVLCFYAVLPGGGSVRPKKAKAAAQQTSDRSQGHHESLLLYAGHAVWSGYPYSEKRHQSTGEYCGALERPGRQCGH